MRYIQTSPRSHQCKLVTYSLPKWIILSRPSNIQHELDFINLCNSLHLHKRKNNQNSKSRSDMHTSSVQFLQTNKKGIIDNQSNRRQSDISKPHKAHNRSFTPLNLTSTAKYAQTGEQQSRPNHSLSSLNYMNTYCTVLLTTP